MASAHPPREGSAYKLQGGEIALYPRVGQLRPILRGGTGTMRPRVHFAADAEPESGTQIQLEWPAQSGPLESFYISIPNKQDAMPKHLHEVARWRAEIAER